MRARLAAAGILGTALAALGQAPVDQVDPFIGTAGDHGQLYPGAVRPFGLVSVSPDTSPSGLNGEAHAGYNYRDTRIAGFSHLRISGTGCSGEGGNLRVMPGFDPDEPAAQYDKSTERASPGYYTVTLASGIRVELTATDHAGLHKYTFPASKRAHIRIDAASTFTRVHRAEVRADSEREASGHVRAGDFCGSGVEYTLYFAAELSRPAASKVAANGREIVFEFAPAAGEAVLLRLGISLIGVAQARANLRAELPGWDFEKSRLEARSAWSRVLDRIRLEGGTPEQRRIFYTSLYRAHLNPMNTTEAGGRYLGFDDKVHEARGYIHYDTYSLWDTFRTKDPLVALIDPDTAASVVRSLIDIYRQSGWMPRWSFLNRDVYLMIGDHATSLIADAYVKGIRQYGIEKVYEGMRKGATVQAGDEEVSGPLPGAFRFRRHPGRPGLSDYLRLGWVPGRPDMTLEYAYNDWCLARVAKALGKTGDAAEFSRRAGNFRNVWDASAGFMRARDSSGVWLQVRDPRAIGQAHCTEGSAWQWTWFAPHDVPGLIALVGGREAFVRRLDRFFGEHLYSHGNEPDLHVAYLYNYAGAPWKTQAQVRRITAEPVTSLYGTHGYLKEPAVDRLYKAQPEGFLIEMDDDCGTMSAWYVFSAMGFYPVCPGSDRYAIGSPLFERVTIQVGEKEFVISARGVSRDNKFIQSASLNGRPLRRAWILHSEIAAGGSLRFVMGPKPNKKWGLDH